MAVLLAMVLGLAGGAVAFFLGALLASVAAGVFHMSNIEGARGYFAVAIGALTGLAGMIVTMIITLRWRGVTSLAGVLGGSLASVGGVAALAAAGFGLYYMAIPHYIHPKGPPVYLKFEIAPPPGGATPDLSTWEVELNTDKNTINGYWDRDAHNQMDGRPVADGRVELHYRTRQRLLVVTMPDQQRRMFRLPLPADPTGARFRNWSEWRKADFAEGPGLNGPTSRSSDYLIRYLVETNIEP